MLPALASPSVGGRGRFGQLSSRRSRCPWRRCATADYFAQSLALRWQLAERTGIPRSDEARQPPALGQALEIRQRIAPGREPQAPEGVKRPALGVGAMKGAVPLGR